ncbi:BglG family transcription antiterminator [Vaginisenegalia massiliensis]|uniref:BglG family transcription antiterminator n=1 Tax=Vaginisenegalia massiliensis TaxID=2058294 RepID=UPI0013DE2EC7|nr:PRD domain-containing protein [Vaginisenegalia massiliensis]
MSTNQGLSLPVSERTKRRLMAKLLKELWHGVVATQNERQHNYSLNIMLNNRTQSMIDIGLLDQIQEVLHSFLKEEAINPTEYQYQTMMIHLTIALDRIQQGYYVSHADMDKHLSILPITQRLVALLEAKFAIMIPELEVYYIDIYLQTMDQANPTLLPEKLEKLEYGREIKQVLSETLTYLEPDELLITQLTYHLNTAVKRLKLNVSIKNPYLDQIRTDYRQAFNSSIEVAFAMANQFDIRFTSDEIAYICVHIQSFFERRQKMQLPVILVCASGMGTARLLEQRLSQRYGDYLHVRQIVGLTQLNQLDIRDELIISTIPIKEFQTQTLCVSPLLTPADCRNIEAFLAKQSQAVYRHLFIRLLDRNLIFFSQGDQENYQTVLQTMTAQLIYQGYGEVGILESAYERERLASTAMGDFAMPHSDVQYVKRSCISLYLNPKGIQWGKQRVRIVFFMALNPQEIEDISLIYKYFNQLVSDKALLERLLQANEADQLINELIERKEE